MDSKHDGYPAIDIDEAILILDDLIDGATESRGRDSRISEVIRLLRHAQAQGDQSWTTPEVSRLLKHLEDTRKARNV